MPAFFDWQPADDLVVLENLDVNVEQVVALRPDLIVARYSNISDAVDQLTRVAPLVPVATDGPWRTDLRFAWLLPQEDGSFIELFANSTAGLLVADLGLRPLTAPPAQTAGAAVEDNGPINAEQVGGIDTDAIVLFDYTDDQLALQQAEASQLWANLPAVQAGRVVKLDLDTSNAAGRRSVLSIPVLLDAIERTFPGLAG